MRTAFLFFFCFTLLVTQAKDYQLFEENGKYGVKDDAGKIIITPAFEGLGWSDGSFSVIGQVTGYRNQNKWGLLNLKAQRITQADYINLVPSGGDRIIAKKQIDAISSKMGCIDLKGNTTVPFKYDGIKINGLQAIVFTKTGSQFNYGVIDLNGNIIIPLAHKNIFTIGSLRYGVQNRDNKTALFSESGNQLTQFVIDSISTFVKNKAVIHQGLNKGIINTEGIIEVAPQYRQIKLNADGTSNARKTNKWMLMDNHHNIITSANCDELTPATSGYIVENGGRYGIWDVNFKSILAPSFKQIQHSEGDLAIVKQNEKFGLIKTDSSVVIPFQFDSLVMSQKLVRAQENLLGKPSWTLYDIYGIQKSERSYESISEFNGKFFIVKNYGLSGIMDRYGKETVQCVYDSILENNDDQIAVIFHGLYGIIDFKENWLLPPQPKRVKLIDEYHYLLLEKDDRLFKNFDGDLIYFTDNKLSVNGQFLREILPDGTEKEINFDGVTISRTAPALVDDTQIITSEYEGLRGIKRNGKYGFIDSKGRLRIANRYEGIGIFSNGLAPVKILGKWGFVNAQDKIVINPSFISVSEFMGDVAIVKKEKFGLVNREGELTLETRYDSIQLLNTNRFLLVNNGLLGLADEKGMVLIDPRFETLEDLGNGFVIVSAQNKYGVLTQSGLSTIPMIYDWIDYLPDRDQFLVKQESPWVKLNLN